MSHNEGQHSPKARYDGHAAPASSKSELAIPILRPDNRNGQRVNCIILSHRIYGVWTHYAGRTVECSAHSGECWLCSLNRPRRWQGYLASYDLSRKRLALLELTAAVAREIDERASDLPTLRSVMLIITRKDQRPNSAQIVTDLTVYKGDALSKMPEPFDVKEVLERLWNPRSRQTNGDHPGPALPDPGR